MVIQVRIDMGNARRRLGRIQRLLKNPIKKAMQQTIYNKLISNIRDAQKERLNPYHYYPHENRMMENNAYVELVGANALIIGDEAPYASVLEVGRNAMHRYKHPFVFHGHYPNYALIAKFSRAMGHTKAYASAFSAKVHGLHEGREWHAGRRVDEETKQVYWVSPRKMRKEAKNVEGWNYKRGVRNAEIRLESVTENRRYLQVPTKRVWNQRKKAFIKPYRYGIYTVFAYDIRAIPPYMVFTKTAEWAQDEILSNLKTEISNPMIGEK